MNSAINNAVAYPGGFAPVANPDTAPRLSATYTNGNLVGATYANPQAVAAGEPDSTAYGAPTNAAGVPQANYAPNADYAGSIGLNTGQTSTQPVITASAAQEDVNNKLSVLKNLQAQLAGQSDYVQQQKLQAATAKAQQDYQASQLALQQQEANTNAQTAAAKTAAVTAATTGTTDTSGTAPGGNITNTGSIPIPQAPDTTGAANNYSQNLAGVANQYSGQLSDVLAQKNALTTSMTNSLNSLMQGTFPLSQTQSALLNSLQTQLQQNTQFQQVANSAYVGQVTEAAYRSGGAFTPGQMAAQINNAVTVGVAKIQALDNSAATTMAQLEQGFQQQDYQLVNDSYNVLSTQLNDKSTAITDTYNAVTSTMKSQYDAVTTAAQQNFTDQMSSANFNMTQSQDANDNMFKQQQITETQWKDNQDSINQRAQIAISQQTANLAQATWNAQYGAFMNANGTPNTSVTPANIPGYTQLPNGMSVIDNSSGLYRTPTMGGIHVLSAAQYTTATTASNDASVLNKMQTLYNQMFTPNGNNATSLAQYAALQNSLSPTLQKMVPSTGVFTGSIVSFHPFSGAGPGNAQFSTAFNQVNSQITSVIPNSQPPQFGTVFQSMADAGNYLRSTGQESVYTNYKSQGFSDADILKIINGQ